MRVHRRLPSPRPAFTLVELIVVITIIAALAALAVAIFPKIQDSQRVTKGADQVQGALFLAKQLALRDQQPRGLRLVQDATDRQVHTLQLIEQPQPYITGQYLGQSPQNQLLATFGGGANFTGGTVQPGDYLDLISDDGWPALHYIEAIPSANTLLLRTAPFQVPPGKLPHVYRIIRAPRPMIGEKEIVLPRDVVVDSPLSPSHPTLGTSLAPVDSQTGQVDILFSPSGRVLRGAGTQGKAILWVWDAGNSAAGGEELLVVVYTRTGVIATHPVNINTSVGDAYQFVRDGKSSGM
jgi:prepilin-type N-terminal cleavage/methylation domain-containing protein